MKKLLALILVCLSFAGCAKKVVDEIKTETYIVTEIKRPKHFRVRLVRESDGLDLGFTGVSKHCRNWQNVQLGTKLQLQVKYYHYEGEPETQYRDIRSQNDLYQMLGCNR